MDGLTKRIDESHACFAICEKECPDGIYSDNPACMCTAARLALGKLLHYQEMEEQGKLLILPLKHGDLVYFITSRFALAEEPIMGRVFGIKLMNDGKIIYRSVTPSIDRRFSSDDIGKTVFMTEQEAKEALEGMKK